ncbi:MAG: FHA domain-containing protein, partial [Specibacter sp.]
LVLPESLELTLAQPSHAQEPAEPGWLLPVGEAVIRLQSLRMEASAAELGHHGAAARPLAGDGGTAAFGEAAVVEATALEDTAHEVADVESPAFEEPVFETPGFETPVFAAADVEAAALEEADGAAPDYAEAAESLANLSWSEEAGPADDAPAAGDEALGEEPAGDEVAGEDAAGEDAEEYDDDAYASFAMAAEAADAEWNAQLAPMAALGEADLNLTIRPDLSEDGHFDAAHFDEEPFTAETFGADPSDAEPLVDGHQLAFFEELAEDVEVVIDAASTAGFDAESDAAAETDAAASTAGGGLDRELPAGEPLDDEQPAGEPLAGQEIAEDGFTTNYDHLFGPTVARSVEDAAVRLDDDGEAIRHGLPEAVVPPLPPMPPVAGIADAMAADLSAASPAQSAAEQWQQEGLLIDSVPWATAPDASAESGADSVPGFAAGPETGASADQPYDPDHDGHTVMRSDVSSDAGTDAGTEEAAAAAPPEPRPATGPMVLARMCPNGHANPPSRSQCSDCGEAINSEPREVGRPRLGTMHISTGEVIELDHSLIIGRQPSVSRVMGGAMPRLVQVTSGNDDISRSHVEVRLDGWDVLLVDLKATNGTVLVRVGAAPRRLSQGEEAILLNGDIAELGDGISLLFEGLL